MYEHPGNTTEQEKNLDNSIRIVKAESFEMKRCLDKGKTMDALKHALQMLNEMRTAELSPKFYYRLYMDSMHELQCLEVSLVQDFSSEPAKLVNLYECVQYASSIIPRLYLLVTIGGVFIKCGLGSRKEILKDLVEMCRGVQHPLRGLFLRNYLMQCTRSVLPDFPETEEMLDVHNSNLPKGATKLKPRDGTVEDTIEFVLINFAEMNKLWVRMQHQGPSKEREKREKDRLELRILVGTNLVRLAQLEALTEDMYVKDVLPSILEQIVSCRDPISQEYLMECVIQVFADDFHLATLNEFLAACAQLQTEVNIKILLIALVDRLALYTTSSIEGGAPTKMKLFEIFSEQATSLIKSRPEMPVDDIVALHVSLVSLAVKCYPDRLDYANLTFQGLRQVIEEKAITEIEAFGKVGRELTKLLNIPVDEYKNVLRLSELPEFIKVMRFFDYRGQCNISAYMIQNMLEEETILRTQENVDAAFELISPLLKDQENQPENSHDTEEFIDEQNLVARLLHLIRADNVDAQFLLLNGVRKVLGEGGRYRLRFTLPPIVFELYRLVLQFAEMKEEDEKWDAKIRKMFVCAMGTIGALVSSAELAELPLKLYLNGAITADRVPFEDNHTVVYEFVSKAMSIMEDDVSDSRDRVRCLQLTVGTLLKTTHLPHENWEPLAIQTVLAAGKMFKKPDQVRSLVTAAALYWHGQTLNTDGQKMRNGKKVVEILKRSAKIAKECLEPIVQQQLFIMLISAYTYYYEDKCPEINVDHIEELISLTQDNSVQLDVSAEADSLEKQLGEAIRRLQLAKLDVAAAQQTSPPEPDLPQPPNENEGL
uniref:Vacuolar protein sorting-associated protein 35 n=1 Tax=Caenorhabditis japonica TaxID=281687 RepID=A0A8R1E0M6_CAEJA